MKITGSLGTLSATQSIKIIVFPALPQITLYLGDISLSVAPNNVTIYTPDQLANVTTAPFKIVTDASFVTLLDQTIYINTIGQQADSYTILLVSRTTEVPPRPIQQQLKFVILPSPSEKPLFATIYKISNAGRVQIDFNQRLNPVAGNLTQSDLEL